MNSLPWASVSLGCAEGKGGWKEVLENAGQDLGHKSSPGRAGGRKGERRGGRGQGQSQAQPPPWGLAPLSPRPGSGRLPQRQRRDRGGVCVPPKVC